jgi:hypothetical protein
MLGAHLVRVNSTRLRHMPSASSFSGADCATLEVHWRELDWQEKSSTN